MKILELNGTSYEMGFKIGETFKTALNKKAKSLNDDFSKKENQRKLKKIRKKLEKEFPEILAELDGKAAGAGVDKDMVLFMNSPELMWKQDACSTAIMIDKDGDVLFSHNEDESDFKKNETMIVTYNYDDYWIIGYGSCLGNIASCFSFNSHGLLFSSNYIFNHGLDTNNVSRYILQRHLIGASSITDLRRRIKEIEVASPFSFNVVDINKRKAYNFEKDLVKVSETKIVDRYARANHFKSKKGEVKKSKSSEFRDTKANELIDKLSTDKVKLKDLKKIMDYKTKDYYKSIFLEDSTVDNSQTVANLTYSTKDNVAVISDYLGNTAYEYELDFE